MIGIIAAVTVGLAIGGWFIRRREAKTGARSKVLRAAAWGVGALLLVIPLAAFVSGFGPAGGQTTRPPSKVVAIDGAGAGAAAAPITGSIDLPAGRYEVVPNKITMIAAKLHAGGEDVRRDFAGDVKRRVAR